MIEYKTLYSIEKETKYYDDLITMYKDFYNRLSNIDDYKLIMVNADFDKKYLSLISTLINTYNGVLYLALDNDKPIGLAFAYENTSNHIECVSRKIRSVEIHDVYVKPEYRNKGIASELIKRVEDLYKSKGINYSSISVLKNNTEAHNLYEKVGYQNRTIDMIKEL